MSRALLVMLCLSACREPALFELPLHPVPERGLSGAGPFDEGATCAAGDGCSDCEALDADCPDGAACASGNGLCAFGCFDVDDDCARLDDGARCDFGEQCTSLRCVAIDGAGTCVSACDDDACASGFTCVDGVCVPTGC